MKQRTWLSWSSGKDSAWTLQALQNDPQVEVCGLLTTVNATHDRVAMHAVRRTLLEAQALALELPLIAVDIPYPCSNEEYQEAMEKAVERALSEGVQAMAFGDLFLEDIRAYREGNLAGTGIRPLFPLWGRDTRQLAGEMVAGGLQATLTCIDPRQCPREMAGRPFDAALLKDLPDGTDPCGENGEFHTFVHAGPMFQKPIPIKIGETVERDGFVFTDVMPASMSS